MSQPRNRTVYYIRDARTNEYLRIILGGEVVTGPKVADSFHQWRLYSHGGSNKYLIQNLAGWGRLSPGEFKRSETSYCGLVAVEQNAPHAWTIEASNDCAQPGTVTISLPESSLNIYSHLDNWLFGVHQNFYQPKEWLKCHWILEPASTT
ncbi:hypothetical protein CPB83DRAFT_861262 [Crepidotus variabilis]|uniref:Uncharacterized protein n=1 Tax=Crepidotus variabilis TaxID=179855 RepID=A0A9P6E8N4_9AGAR|nr:hypothetical protein CPB83DRAFT_861262 [Crepidotus variabilis]